MIFRGNGSVWDKEKNKMLVRFGKAKMVETNDEYIVNKLFKLGYKAELEEFIDVDYKAIDEVEKAIDEVEEFDGPFELKIENNFDGLTKKEIVEELKAQGIEVPKDWKRVKKDDLIDLFGGE